MKKLILSPSYFTAPLYILLLINNKKASYFYPYVAMTCLLGIIIILSIMIDEDKKKLWNTYFPSNISNQFTDTTQIIIYIFTILFKLVVIFYWPYNISCKSILISLLYLCLYIIYYSTL